MMNEFEIPKGILRLIKKKSNEFNQRAFFIQENVNFFNSQAQTLLNKIQRLEKKSYLPDAEAKAEKLINQLINISKRIDYSAAEVSKLESDIEIFDFSLTHQIEIQVNPPIK